MFSECLLIPTMQLCYRLWKGKKSILGSEGHNFLLESNQISLKYKIWITAIEIWFGSN